MTIQTGPDVNDASTRPFVFAKFSDVYLIAAEAYFKMGDNANAAAMLNVLRQRAAFGTTNPGRTCGRHCCTDHHTGTRLPWILFWMNEPVSYSENASDGGIWYAHKHSVKGCRNGIRQKHLLIIRHPVRRMRILCDPYRKPRLTWLLQDQRFHKIPVIDY